MKYGRLILFMLFASCSDSTEGLLAVDLSTDYVAQIDFRQVRTSIRLDGETFSRDVLHQAGREDYATPTRIAEFSGLQTGSYIVQVELVRANGSTLGQRRFQVLLGDGYILDARIDAVCESVSCPRDGDPNATECLNGTCVPPDCITPSNCNMAECEESSECMEPTVACKESACVFGACRLVDIEGACPAQHWCDPASGCQPYDIVRDAGVDVSMEDAPVDVGPDTGGSTDFFRRPFSENSPWNTPIPSNATYRDDANIRYASPNREPYVWINVDPFGVSLLETSSNLEPVTITYEGSYGVIEPGTVELRIGPNTAHLEGSVVVFDHESSIIWNFRRLVGTGNTRTAAGAVSHPMNGFGVGDPNYDPSPYPAGTFGSGTSQAGGLVRGWHFDRGAEINHAFAATLRNEQLAAGWVPPAISEHSDAANSYVGTIPLGTRLAIPQNVDLSTLGFTTEYGLRMAQAAQKHGVLIVGRHEGDASLTLYASPSELNTEQLGPLRAQWLIILNELRVVERQQRR